MPFDPFSVGGMLVGGLLQGFGGGGGDSNRGPLTSLLGIPDQRNYLQSELANLMRGGGDFGFGREARMGASTLNKVLQQRGLSPTGGAATSGLAQMLAQVASNAAQRRQQYGLQLAMARPWTEKSERFGGSWYTGQWRPDNYAGPIAGPWG